MKQFRIGLRAMLLVVALFAVFFAWMGAKRELQRVKIQSELDDLQHSREYAVINRNNYISDEAWRSRMSELDAAISDKKQHLD